MHSSFALWCLFRESVVISTSSFGWPRIFSFLFIKARSKTRFTRIRAFALIPFMEHDLVFLSIFVNSFTLASKESGSSFATHCFTFCRDCSFPSRVLSSDSSLLSACVNKTCSSSVRSEEDVVTTTGIVWISSRILRRIFSVTLSSNLERKSAAVLIEPARCANLKLNCNA